MTIEKLGLPELVAWGIAVEVARGRMADGWVPVDAALILAINAEIERLKAVNSCVAPLVAALEAVAELDMQGALYCAQGHGESMQAAMVKVHEALRPKPNV